MGYIQPIRDMIDAHWEATGKPPAEIRVTSASLAAIVSEARPLLLPKNTGVMTGVLMLDGVAIVADDRMRAS